jgi:hypothetical protein
LETLEWGVHRKSRLKLAKLNFFLKKSIAFCTRHTGPSEVHHFADFRDLDKDLSERRRRRGKADQPMSLWEELADIGEEFVEFLEKEISLSSSKASL